MIIFINYVFKNQNEVIIKEPYYVRVGTPTERAIDLMVEKNISSLIILLLSYNDVIPSSPVFV